MRPMSRTIRETDILGRFGGEEFIVFLSTVDSDAVMSIAENVRRNVEALMPGGGYVFNTVHNIQSDVPPENVIAMLDAVREYG